jgi:hypothetical protein
MNLEDVKDKIRNSVRDWAYNSVARSVWDSGQNSVWNSVVVSVAYFVGDSVNFRLQELIREERDQG